VNEPTIPTVQEIFERVSRLPDNAIVGVCGSPSDCLIGMHMQAQRPDLDFEVRVGERMIDLGPIAYIHANYIAAMPCAEGVPA
jgi:hypothetical protein